MRRGAHFSVLGLARVRDLVADQKKSGDEIAIRFWGGERGRRRLNEMFRAPSFLARQVFPIQRRAFKPPLIDPSRHSRLFG